MTIASLVVLLLLSVWSFKFIPKVFVPALDKQYFTVDMWLPEGTTIGETDRIAGEISDYIRTHEETEMVSSYIGRTPPRYYLSNTSFGSQSIYAKVSVPLFESGKRRDEKRASSFKVGMVTDNLNQITDQVKLEVETVRVSLSQTMEQVCLTEGSLSKAFENERMVLERYAERNTFKELIVESN